MLPSDEFNAKVYKSKNPDLNHFAEEEDFFEHFKKHGARESRVWTEINTRDSFLRLLEPQQSALEIGVFDRPSLEFLLEMGVSVDYADWMSKDELISRAQASEGRDPQCVPDIKYVLKHGYEQISLRYDAVVSHHCVEHQPDFIRHIWQIRSILAEHGSYFFTLPDKRCCFDHFIPESSIVDILDAFYCARVAPPFKSVLEHRCFTSHSFVDGINPYKSRDPAFVERFNLAFNEFNSIDYVDVHCWIFTPLSFKELYLQLTGFGLLPPCTDLKVYTGSGEFYVAVQF